MNDALYYEATVDFTRDPVRFRNEKINDVAFYIDVVGMDEQSAVRALNGAGYTNISVVYEKSFEAEGTVFRQSPEYSTAPNLDKTTVIVLTVSRNETETQVPPPTQEPTQPVETTEETLPEFDVQ